MRKSASSLRNMLFCLTAVTLVLDKLLYRYDPGLWPIILAVVIAINFFGFSVIARLRDLEESFRKVFQMGPPRNQEELRLASEHAYQLLKQRWAEVRYHAVTQDRSFDSTTVTQILKNYLQLERLCQYYKCMPSPAQMAHLNDTP